MGIWQVALSSLEQVLGRETTAALCFHISTESGISVSRLLAEHPEKFRKTMISILQADVDMILNRVASSLCEEFGLDSSHHSFVEVIRELKKKKMSGAFVTYEQRELDDLCRTVCEIDDDILAVAVSEGSELVGTCLRKWFPVPAKQKLNTMLLQAAIVFSIAKSSEDFHGHARHVTLRYDNIDEHLFPIGTEDKRMMIVSTKPDAMGAELAERIASIALARNRHDSRILGE